MVEFCKDFTEVVFFDLESYVPPEDRTKKSKSSLIYNAANPKHFILGGVFRRMFPMKETLELPVEIWNFRKEDEKTTLTQIYEYFKKSWQLIDNRNRKNHPDLILIGTGISRFDIPALYVRSQMHKVDSDEALYETYFKAKVVDLGDVGIPLFRKHPEAYTLYPKTNRELITELQVKSTKTSGKIVWDLFDSGTANDYAAIKARTLSEVNDAIEIAKRIIAKCRDS